MGICFEALFNKMGKLASNEPQFKKCPPRPNQTQYAGWQLLMPLEQFLMKLQFMNMCNDRKYHVPKFSLFIDTIVKSKKWTTSHILKDDSYPRELYDHFRDYEAGSMKQVDCTVASRQN